MLLRPQDESKSSGDSFRRQQDAWRRAYAEALSLRERFPAVEEIVFEMAFTDLKSMGTYSPQMRSLSASAKAFFAIPCPRTLCLDGGFDLDSIIASMLGSGGTKAGGTLECQGWLDPARPEHARCLLQMHYRLHVRYDTPKAGKQRQAHA
jgi:hypothetical protein